MIVQNEYVLPYLYLRISDCTNIEQFLGNTSIFSKLMAKYISYVFDFECIFSFKSSFMTLLSAPRGVPG